MLRQIVLDTETTGLSPEKGHRLIEIGCLELINRRMTKNHFHTYINPERDIDSGAVQVHGITRDFLKDKPMFSEIAEKLFSYLNGGELIIHNAPFDVGFLHAEFSRINASYVPITRYCTVIDTLLMARRKHPGQQNTLDALCRRYGVDNKHRDLHGALVDAALLSEVYLLMTGGQAQLGLSDTEVATSAVMDCHAQPARTVKKRILPVIAASSEEIALHEAFLNKMHQKNNG